MSERRKAGGSLPARALLLRCAWCGRIKIDGAWIAAADVPDASHNGQTIEQDSHGICPDCDAKLAPHQPL